jgi:O-6-methylguanine DNA methyltransferase
MRFNISTDIGDMTALIYNECLYYLKFSDKLLNLEKVEKYIKDKNQINNKNKDKQYSQILQNQINEYFQGTRKDFNIKYEVVGTEFQKNSWNALLGIPYGQVISYKKQAIDLNKPTYYRAVAHANAWNNIYLIIPCHRVVMSDGSIGGYGGKVYRKEFLLKLENKLNN